MLYTVSNAAAKMSHSSSGQPLVIQRGGSVYGANLPLITELVNDTNVQFLDDDDEDDMVTYQIPFLIVFRLPLTDGRSGRWHPIVTILSLNKLTFLFFFDFRRPSSILPSRSLAARHSQFRCSTL